MEKYSKFLKKKKLTIFLFHGVIDKNPFKIRNYTKKHLLKKEFIKVLNDLKNNKGICLSLDKVFSTIKKREDFKDYSYSITFDDGFYNNYKIAAPILKKRKLHATFYLTTNFVDKNEMSWIDKIEHMIENTKSKKIIKIFSRDLKIENNKKSKIQFLNSIRFLAKKNKVNFNELVLNIKNQIGYNHKLNNLGNILDKKMNWKQVKKLNTSKYFSIGGHTVNHPILSFLKYNKAKKEINDSINIIQTKTKIKIHHYSYPEGLKHTYGEREINLLKKRGIKICPSAEFGVNTKYSNLFHLNRIFVNK
jgi:peptidoglycan/xylan/chitin deacetylase (PgdA/CDA1 family)|tara:strand:+ start:760 stop:1674 length:915 start_codon:yes stop_codon:yes gene_type:complete